jgi:outer membrane protein assembly factor BamE (lipoprotein component of BamABCDE complex)
MFKTRRSSIIRVVLLTAICSLGGCLVTASSETTHNGTRVAPDTFAQIKPGTTTAGWVEATLGPPTSKNKTGDDEVWKYVYTEHTDSGGAIFLIFGGSGSSDKSETSFIEFKDGVVINKWRG